MIDYVSVLTVAANKAMVPPLLLMSICFQESSFRNVVVPHDGRSPSYGICQLKLKTARQFEPTVTRAQLMSESVNADIAARYLSWLLDRYDGNVHRAVDAYNRGHAGRKPSQYTKKVLAHSRRKPWKQLAGQSPY